ncbi:hypothetical protein NM208_g10950 [Fusarium decemcellulare]|uniref:Uncharacterized protein n=1 Tax=Fusarium decemcellulare TaxID=57161 RepID=A0ACC1RW27_9HYPO|nr:hypothetical protein NM208_g10950 [Fusarium decemcellulare]
MYHSGDRDIETSKFCDLAKNLDLIHLLLDHGADPRLIAWNGGHLQCRERDQEAAYTGEASSQDQRPLVCQFCRQEKEHDGHYWSYADTDKEQRTFECTNIEFEEASRRGIMRCRKESEN